jgi:hypothetical protein
MCFVEISPLVSSANSFRSSRSRMHSSS